MSTYMLNQIRIVLINTSHPGNIGAAARAMKTMGLTQLYIVAPLLFPDPKADEMASLNGVKLGRVITFSEDFAAQPPVFANYAMSMKSEAAGAPAPDIQAGSKELTVSVSVTYEIE